MRGGHLDFQWTLTGRGDPKRHEINGEFQKKNAGKDVVHGQLYATCTSTALQSNDLGY